MENWVNCIEDPQYLGIVNNANCPTQMHTDEANAN